jgi:hypothetical protein
MQDLPTPRWFRSASGEHEGRLHISGWMLSAIKGEALGQGPAADGWLYYGICPVCHAMVVTAQHNPMLGDHSWVHERWHARTDFPVPDELLTDEDREAGYGRPQAANKSEGDPPGERSGPGAGQRACRRISPGYRGETLPGPGRAADR